MSGSHPRAGRALGSPSPGSGSSRRLGPGVPQPGSVSPRRVGAGAQRAALGLSSAPGRAGPGWPRPPPCGGCWSEQGRPLASLRGHMTGRAGSQAHGSATNAAPGASGCIRRRRHRQAEPGPSPPSNAPGCSPGPTMSVRRWLLALLLLWLALSAGSGGECAGAGPARHLLHRPGSGGGWRWPAGGGPSPGCRDTCGRQLGRASPGRAQRPASGLPWVALSSDRHEASLGCP